LNFEVANVASELNCVETACRVFSSSAQNRICQSKSFYAVEDAEFSYFSTHYAFCVQHKSYVALLNTSFLDHLNFCFRLCMLESPDSHMECPICFPMVIGPSLEVEHCLNWSSCVMHFSNTHPLSLMEKLLYFAF
jgi:hypothetical protein